MRFRRFAAVAVGLFLAAAAAPRAHASFHLMKVVEVFPGTAAAPTAQYVVLQMYFSGQNLVSTRVLHFYDSAGVSTLAYTIPTNVAVANDQSKILFATAAAESFFGTAGFADFTLP